MIPSFNLVDERWIPCVFPNRQAPIQIGIAEALARAHEIVEIGDSSPLTTIALHRLLLAILHRNFGPARLDEWANLWERGRWDTGRLQTYFERWRSRFDLFDEQHPFYQVKTLDFQYERSISQLTHELASGANPVTLFDHTIDASFSPAEAARYLIAHQAFTVGGLVSLEKGQDPKLYKSAKAGPLLKAAITLVKGRNLFETLMLNLHQYSPAEGEPFPSQPDDCPAWERAEETRAEDRRPNGYLDLLTWQSRRIRLHPEIDEENRVALKRVVIMKGNQFPDSYWRHGKETMMPFRRDLQAKDGQEPWPAIGFDEDRALWRDSSALFQTVADVQVRPKMLRWLNDLTTEGIIKRSQTIPLEVFGVSTFQANVLFWRQERLPVPLVYLDDQRLFARLREALQLAEGIGRLFRTGFDAAQRDGKRVKIPRPFQILGAALATSTNQEKPNQEMIRQVVAHLAPERRYWARLEAPFKKLLIALAADRVEIDERSDYGGNELPRWARTLSDKAREVFQDTSRGMVGSGRSLKAVAEAERAFNYRLRETLKGYLKEGTEVAS